MALLCLLAILIFLWVAERELPSSWTEKIAERLSNDQVSIQIGRSAFGLRRGIVLYRVRAFACGSLDSSFASVDEVALACTIRLQRPYIEWIDSINIRNLVCRDLPETLAFADETGNDWLKKLDLTGLDITVNGADVLGLTMERVSGTMTISEGVLKLSQVQIVWPTLQWSEIINGELTIDVEKDFINGDLKGYLTPVRVKPLLQKLHARAVIRICENFVFLSEPVNARCKFNLNLNNDDMDLYLDLRLRNVLYRNVPIREANAIIKGTGSNTISHVTIAPFNVIAEAGRANASIFYDDVDEILTVDAQGEMEAIPLTELIDVLNDGELNGINFERPPRLTVKGTVGVARHNAAPADLTGTIDAPSINIMGIPLKNALCDFSVNPDHSVNFKEINSRFGLNGRITGFFTLYPGTTGNQARCHTKLQLSEINLADICKIGGVSNVPASNLKANIELRGRFMDDENSGDGTTRIEQCTFAVTDGSILDMPFDYFEGDLSITNGTTEINIAKIIWPVDRFEETARGKLVIKNEPAAVKGNFEAKTTPQRIRPILSGFGAYGAVSIGDMFAFTSHPAEVKGTFEIHPDKDQHNVNFMLLATNVACRGVPLQSMAAKMVIDGHGNREKVSVSDIKITSENGSAYGELIYDDPDDILTVAAQSRLGVTQFLQITGLDEICKDARLQFKDASVLGGKGVIGLSPRSRGKTDFNGSLVATNAVLHGLPLQHLSSTFILGADYDTTFTNIAATSAGGGSINGSLRLTPEFTDNNTNLAYNTSLIFNNMAFGEFYTFFDSTNYPPGILNAKLLLAGYLDDERITKPTGSGVVNIKNGSIARIPLFAGFTDYLARNVPGVETVVNQSSASFNFKALEGIMTTSDLLIEGEVFSLAGKGQYNLPKDNLDFNIQAGIFKRGSLIGKVTRIFTLPFSKLFLEFRVFGTSDAPSWEYRGIIQRVTDTVSDFLSPGDNTNNNQ